MRKLPGFRLTGVLAAGLLLACGDAPTTDTRGYTKAPLEDASLLIRPEPPTAMDSLGNPVLPRDTLIPPPTQTGN
jgi:hypothetical protein